MKPFVLNRTRFNLLDACILALVLLFLCALVFYLLPPRADTQEASYTVTCTGVRADFAARIDIGDAVYDQNGTALLGYVTNLFTELDTLSLTDPVTKETREVLYPEGTVVSLTLTLKTADAREKDGSVTVNGAALAPNTPLSFRTEDVALSGTCTTLAFEGGAA